MHAPRRKGATGGPLLAAHQQSGKEHGHHYRTPLGRYAYGRTRSSSLFLILSVQCDLKRKCTALPSVAASAAYFETAFLVSIHHRGTWKGILVASFTSPRGPSTISSEVDVPLS